MKLVKKREDIAHNWKYRQKICQIVP